MWCTLGNGADQLQETLSEAAVMCVDAVAALEVGHDGWQAAAGNASDTCTV